MTRASSADRPSLDSHTRRIRYVCVGGIRSTGLTSSMAIAEYVTELLTDGGLSLGVARASRPPRMPTLAEDYRRPYQSADLIAEDPPMARSSVTASG